MTKAKMLYVANPKAYLSFTQTNRWLDEGKNVLEQYARQHTIIACPSFTSLDYAHQTLASTAIAWGAQDCSAHQAGPHTSQITAQSLSELGCRYCLVGHSETRQYTTHQELTDKISQLFAYQITPIVCISSANNQELEPIKHTLETNPSFALLIAYEPLEAIGSGNVVTTSHLQDTFQSIKQQLSEYQQNTHFKLLYGGSVTAATVRPLKAIADLDGFLIGKACTQIAEFRAIIEA